MKKLYQVVKKENDVLSIIFTSHYKKRIAKKICKILNKMIKHKKNPPEKYFVKTSNF
jgi:hypothetical protein